MLVAAPSCHGHPNPGPTTPTTTPSTIRPLTAAQKRCLADGRHLGGIATGLVRIVTVHGATPGRSGMPAAIESAEAALAQLNGRAVQPRFSPDRRALITAANDMIAGYRGILAGGNHPRYRTFLAMVTAGANAAGATDGSIRT